MMMMAIVKTNMRLHNYAQSWGEGFRDPIAGFRDPSAGFRDLSAGLRDPDWRILQAGTRGIYISRIRRSGFRDPIAEFRDPGWMIPRAGTRVCPLFLDFVIKVEG
ncbi:hypothetical protein F2Q70_00030264 [Brassica cretica]|uniref:Uncharacterized protein n=1 Tax=Brassica cretica TaxID=69181 RepID=A0A8S9FP28_BRACR|nr:hypothetical protein F2Q70_00030264 [Brassica cretica]